MSAIAADLAAALLRDLAGLQRELDLYPDDAAIWAVLPGVTNAAGNLALHVAGNIQHFIGREIGGTSYARDREAEFGRRSGSRADVVAELDRAMAVVRDVVPALPAARLEAPFTAHPGVVMPTQRFLLHLCTHTAFHLGQVGYLRRLVTGDPTSSNTMSARNLAPIPAAR